MLLLCYGYLRLNTANLFYYYIQIVSVVLENHGRASKEFQEVGKVEDHASPSPEILTKVHSWRMIVDDNGEISVTE